MTLPSVTRSWQYGVNLNSAAGADTTATNRALLRQIKNMLIGAGGVAWTDGVGAGITDVGRWTVIGSCDSSTSNMTGTDLWAADANLVGASGVNPHSWIVLQQTGVATKFQILIELSTAAHYQCTMSCSHTGFGTANGGTNGSTTVAPTALNQQTLLSATDWGGPQSAVATRVHVIRSSDGAATRLILCRNNHTTAFWQFELAGNAVSGWTTPYIARAVLNQNTTSPTVDSPLLADLTSAANIKGFGSALFSAFMTAEGETALSNHLIVQTQAGVNGLSGLSPIFPIGVYTATATQEGRHGNVVDCWLGLIGKATGTTYPASGTVRQFVHWGPLITPWNQSVPLIA